MGGGEGGPTGPRGPRSGVLGTGPQRDQLVTTSPHPSDNASSSDQESLGAKVPGLSSQSVAFR